MQLMYGICLANIPLKNGLNLLESRYREGLPAWVYSKYGVLLKKVGKVKKARLIFEKGLALQDKDSYEQLLYQYGYLEYE